MNQKSAGGTTAQTIQYTSVRVFDAVLVGTRRLTSFLVAWIIQHFLRAARADLVDVRGNARDGIHGASAGGLWQAVVFGFAGLRLDEAGWRTEPALPPGWTSLSFSFLWRGQRQDVVITAS